MLCKSVSLTSKHFVFLGQSSIDNEERRDPDKKQKNVNQKQEKQKRNDHVRHPETTG